MSWRTNGRIAIEMAAAFDASSAKGKSTRTSSSIHFNASSASCLVAAELICGKHADSAA